MSGPDPLAPARAKLDAKIADAARDLCDSIHEEKSAREGTRLLVSAGALDVLRAQIAAWHAFNETLGDGS